MLMQSTICMDVCLFKPMHEKGTGNCRSQRSRQAHLPKLQLEKEKKTNRN